MASHRRLLIGAPLSLSGRYAMLGRLAAVGLWQLVQDLGALGGGRVGTDRLPVELAILDDGSTAEGVRRALEELAESDLLIGPYGSDLVAEAARFARPRGKTLWNHGGSADEVQQLPGVISAPSPASAYLGPVLEAVGEAASEARVLVATGPGRFGRAATRGATRAAERLGMDVVGTVTHSEVPEAPNADVVLAAGTFADDLALVRRLRAGRRTVAAVAAGLGRFGAELGPEAEGVLGPSQWEEAARFRADVGPRALEVIRSLRAGVLSTLRAEAGGAHVDYPTAQAYATGLIALRCAEEAGTTDHPALDRVARTLSCTTFFGRFRLSEDGLQGGHEVLVVQWQDGLKRVVWPPSQAEAPIRLESME